MMKDPVINLSLPTRPVTVPAQPAQSPNAHVAEAPKPIELPGVRKEQELDSVQDSERSGDKADRQAGLSQRDLEDMVSEINQYFQAVHRDLQFTVHEGSGRTIIKVLDSETKELIREIPPERMVEMAETFKTRGDLGSMGVAEEA
jgi:flagellar protein FlaG